jgi:hypothetical protein
MKYQTSKDLVTDEEIIKAWGHANFGNQDKREVLKESMVRILGGYSTGHTAKCIMQELGIMHSSKQELTKFGRKFLAEMLLEEEKAAKDVV